MDISYCFSTQLQNGTSLSLLMAQSFFMKAKKENYWFMFRVLLLANVVLIAVIVFAHSGPKQPRCKTAPCSGVKRINADILNSVMVKLM